MSPVATEHGAVRVGIGGPVGSGKTRLVERLLAAARGRRRYASR